MNDYSKYRIKEGVDFKVQKKGFFGWHDYYDWQRAGLGIFISSIFLFVLLIAHIVSFLTHNPPDKISYFLTAIPVVWFLLARFWYKFKFDTLQEAKSFIDNEIKAKEEYKKKNKEIKEKLANKKIHYFDLKTERKEKLKKINI